MLLTFTRYAPKAVFGRLAADWDENKHPRDDDGQFADVTASDLDQSTTDYTKMAGSDFAKARQSAIEHAAVRLKGQHPDADLQSALRVIGTPWLGAVGASVEERLAGSIFAAWGTASGNTPQLSLLQLAIQDEFGLDAAETGHLLSIADIRSKLTNKNARGEAIPATDADISNLRSVMRTLVRAQYDRTQERLASGPESWSLVRGVRLPKGTDLSGVTKLQPGSSFSTRRQDAEVLAFHERTGEDVSVLMRARVPRSRILSTAFTGFGHEREHEILILGGKLKVKYEIAKGKSKKSKWVALAEWNESKHPRDPAGVTTGGQWVNQGEMSHARLSAHYDQWAKGLSSGQQVAIRGYGQDWDGANSSSCHQNLNRLLRGHEILAPEREGKYNRFPDEAELRKNVDLIASAIDSAPAPPGDLVVHRGVRLSSHEQPDIFGAITTEGATVRLDGFQSTDIRKNHRFTEGQISSVLHIKPRRGAYIEPVVNVGKEFEFLLPHGAQYRVVKVLHQNVWGSNDGRYEVWLEMLDGPNGHVPAIARIPGFKVSNKTGYKSKIKTLSGEYDGDRFYLPLDAIQLISMGRALTEWDESQHPRVPAGDPGGGEFAHAGFTVEGDESDGFIVTSPKGDKQLFYARTDVDAYIKARARSLDALAKEGGEFPFADEGNTGDLHQHHLTNQLFDHLHMLDAVEDPDERENLASINKDRVSKSLSKVLAAKMSPSDLQQLADLLGSPAATPARSVSNFLVDGWAMSSGDTNAFSVMYQHAVVEELGTDAELGHLMDGLGLDAVKSRVAGELGDGFAADNLYTAMKIHARAQYTETQTLLKGLGSEGASVSLWRGVNMDPADGVKVAKSGVVALQPLSSFSSSRDVALDFASASQGYHAHEYDPAQSLQRAHLIRATFPRSRVFSMPRTGFGCLAESEWVILGDRSTKVRISKRWGKFQKSDTRAAEFNDSQPRVPAGHPGGGQWTDSGSEFLTPIGPQSKESPFEDVKAWLVGPGGKLYTTKQGMLAENPDDHATWSHTRTINGPDKLSAIQTDQEAEFVDATGLDRPTAQQAKTGVEQLIGAHLEQQLSRDELKEMCNLLGVPSTDLATNRNMADKIAGRLVQQWAVSSGDTSPFSVLMQDAINQEFGLDAVMDHLTSDEAQFKHREAKTAVERAFIDLGLGPKFADADTVRQRELIPRVMRAHARAQYVETQKVLTAAGIDHVDLVRGAILPRDSAIEIGRTGVAHLQPASSFSLSYGTAEAFAHSGREGTPTIIRSRVPRHRILSFPKTGFGCLSERELVVLGGKIKVRIMHWL